MVWWYLDVFSMFRGMGFTRGLSKGPQWCPIPRSFYQHRNLAPFADGVV